jgi:hypothetical protein
MTLDVRGGLRQEEVDTYRQFLQRSGFHSQFNVDQSLDNLEVVEDLEDEQDENDDLPTIEPI